MSNQEQKRESDQTPVSGRLSKSQQEVLDSMVWGKWYDGWLLGNGKSLKKLCEIGLLEYEDHSTVTVGYKPWKYDKRFRLSNAR